ncbi:UNVERIFIED_CONTAM: hypothetical protein RMT77_019575 [Armadillidium vulgare]
MTSFNLIIFMTCLLKIYSCQFSQGFSSVRYGCPDFEFPPKPCIYLKNMRIFCSANSDCPEEKLCCFDLCIYRCMNPVPMQMW